MNMPRIIEQVKSWASPALFGLCIYFVSGISSNIEQMSRDIQLLLRKQDVQEQIIKDLDRRVTLLERKN